MWIIWTCRQYQACRKCSKIFSQYLNQGTIKDHEHLNDTLDFTNMCKSMEKVGFSSEDKHHIFRGVAAIMHLGNVNFENRTVTSGQVTRKNDG